MHLIIYLLAALISERNDIMSIHKNERTLKNGQRKLSYDVKYYTPDPKNHNKQIQTTKRGFRTKAEAEKFDRQMKTELQNGTIANDQQKTLGKYLKQYFEDLELQDYSPNTLDGYRRNINNYLIPRIGRVKLSELRPSHIQNAYTDLLRNGGVNGRGLSPTTVIYTHRVLHRALKLAVNRQLISFNPADRVELPRKAKYNAKTYTLEQLTTLFQQVEGSYMEIPIKLAGMLGLRRGEISAIRWSDIELDKEIMHIRRGEVAKYKNKGTLMKSEKNKATKNNYTRDILLPKPLVDLLKKEKVQQKLQRVKVGIGYEKNDYICIRNDGNRISLQQLSVLAKRQIKVLTETKGYPDINLHGLRHSAATYMLNEGISMDVVRDILGHSSISVTVDLYGHILNEQRKKAAGIMERAFEVKKDMLNIG